jgi:rhamnose utilization protein RhaD (predicted bifunctional aldolase and dehydrogenase)
MMPTLPHHPSPTISDASLERALDWLRDNAEAIGQAKADSVATARMREHVLALEMKRHSELPVSAQEREAKASKAYRQAIIEEAKAAGAYETMRAMREAAALKIEAWRSEQANFRAMKIG